MFCYYRIILSFLLIFLSSSLPLHSMESGTSMSSIWWRTITENKEKIGIGALVLGIVGFFAYKVYQGTRPCSYEGHKRPEDKTFHELEFKLKEENEIITLTPDIIQEKTTEDDLYTIVQLKVASQAGATCAYHALKNGLYMAMLPFARDEVTYHNIGHALECKHIIERFIGNSGIWRTTAKDYIIKKKRELPDDAEWLDKEAIEDALLICERRKSSIVPAEFWDNDNVTIIDNIANIASSMYDEKFLKLCRAMRDERTSLVHIFLIGTMNQYSDNSGVSNGHWYTLVVNKVDKDFQFFVSDSLGSSRIDDKRVKKIIKYLLVNGDSSAMTQRLYLDDILNTLLEIGIQYISDEYSQGKYSRIKRAKKITKGLRELELKFEEHGDKIRIDLRESISEFINMMQDIISLSNEKLKDCLPKYINIFKRIRQLLNQSAHLQTDESDDFDVSLKMWLIIQYIVSERGALCLQIPSLAEDIQRKINKARHERKEFGTRFLKEINKKKPNTKDLLELVSCYVNA